MKQLSGMDNLFLAMETGNQYMHVGGLGIYDSSTVPGGAMRFKDILKFFSARLPLAKIFSRRLVTTPLNLDRPHWIEGGEVDVEYHVRHIALPKPGDWRQLMIQVARIHARPLDRAKPLWEAYVIEGLDNIPGIAPGSFALYIKMHHAAVDGEAGAAIIKAIHSLSPAGDESPANAATQVRDSVPTAVELYSRAVGNRSKLMFDAAKLVASLGGRAAGMGKTLVTQRLASLTDRAPAPDAGSDAAPATPAKKGRGSGLKPITRFDTTLSPHRVVDAVGFPMADCQRIRQHVPDVTINDIFMATSGGALRKYLAAKNELPERSLNALMPMSTRSRDKAADVNAGNQVGLAAMPLRTDIADPLERLEAIRHGTRKSKSSSASLGRDLPGKLFNVLPAFATIRLLQEGLYKRANVAVSNVRGPDVPLYLAGAQMQLFLPVSLPSDGMGLNITAFSYNGTFWVCFVTCRDMLPDPSLFAQCLNESFADILDAALKLPLAAATAEKAPAKKTLKPAAKITKATAPVKKSPRKPASKPAGKPAGKPASKPANKATSPAGKKAAVK